VGPTDERPANVELLATALRRLQCSSKFAPQKPPFLAQANMRQKPTPKSPTIRRRIGQPGRAQRSRITNGKEVLPGVSGRSAIVRRYKDIASALLADAGGLDQCSESRQQLIRRFSAACVLAEQLESRLANGEQIAISEHALLVSSLVRLANKIGIARHARNITPTVQDYLASRRHVDDDDEALEAAE
jgi:hypothetical protein